MSVTYFKKSLKKRARKHGFRSRMKTHDGREIIKRRRSCKRSSLSVSDR